MDVLPLAVLQHSMDHRCLNVISIYIIYIMLLIISKCYAMDLLGLIYIVSLPRFYTMCSQMKSAINWLLQVKPWVIQRMHPYHWVATFARMKIVCGSLMQKWPERHSNAACPSYPTVAPTKAPLVWMRGVDMEMLRHWFLVLLRHD